LEAATKSAQSAGDNAWMLMSAALVLMMTGPRRDCGFWSFGSSRTNVPQSLVDGPRSGRQILPSEFRSARRALMDSAV
jgi:hypothetical protein